MLRLNLSTRIRSGGTSVRPAVRIDDLGYACVDRGGLESKQVEDRDLQLAPSQRGEAYPRSSQSGFPNRRSNARHKRKPATAAERGLAAKLDLSLRDRGREI